MGYCWHMKCIVCHSESVPDTGVVRETPAYDCPRCGTFRASDITSAVIERQVKSPEAVIALSAAILKLDRHGERYPLVDIGFMEYVLKRHRLHQPAATHID